MTLDEGGDKKERDREREKTRAKARHAPQRTTKAHSRNSPLESPAVSRMGGWEIAHMERETQGKKKRKTESSRHRTPNAATSKSGCVVCVANR